MNRKLKKFAVTAGLVGMTLLFSPETADAAEIVRIDLNSSIERALMNNRDIEQSARDRDTAKWYYSRSRRQMGPKLSWNSSYMHIGDRDYSGYREMHDNYGDKYHPSYDNEFTNVIGLEMPLYTGGQQESEIGSARYRMNYADLALENTRQEIKYQTTAAYYQILQRRALVRVEEEAVNLLQEHLNNVTIQYEVGTVAKSDVLASKVQLAARRQSLVTANGNYLNAIADLNNLIGLDVDTVLVAEEELGYKKYNVTLNECIDYALENRPDGAAADYAIKQAEMNLKGSKSGYRPNLTAVAEKNVSGEGSFSQNHSEAWNIGVRMTWNIFDNGVTTAQSNEAKSELEKEKSKALQVREKIRLEVSKAYNDLVAAEKNITITSEAIKMAEEDYSIAQLRYLEGIDTNLSVMDAQEKLTEAQTNYYNALYSYNIAAAALDKARGIPVNINVPLYVSAEKMTKSPDKALKKSQIN